MTDEGSSENAAARAAVAPDAAETSPPRTTVRNSSADASIVSASGVVVSATASDKEQDERAQVRAKCVAVFRTGASYREVAERLHLTIGTVQGHIKYARRTGELGDEAPARAKGRPRLINDAIDAMLARIIQEKGTKNARMIQEELAKPPHSTKLSYEVVRRRVKHLIDSVAALPHPGQAQSHQLDAQEDENTVGDSDGQRGHEQMARDLDMLAETVRSIVTNVAQAVDGDDQDGGGEDVGEDMEGGDGMDEDFAFEPSVNVIGEATRQAPPVLIEASNIQSAPDNSTGASADPTSRAVNNELPSGQVQVAVAGDAPRSEAIDIGSSEPRRCSGRPRSMKLEMDGLIVAELGADPGATTRAIHAKLLARFQGLDVSFETVRRRVHEIRTQNALSNSAGADGTPAVGTTSSGSVADQSAASAEAELAASGNATAAIPTGQRTPSPARRPKKGEYSPHMRALCVEKHEVDGMSYASISKELDIPQDSVRAIIRKAKRTGSVQSAPRSGRPRKTTEIIDRVILQAVRANERSSAKSIQESLLKVFNVKVSSETIRRRVLANTRQRLLAVSSGVQESSTSDPRSLEGDVAAAAAAVASALAKRASETQSTESERTIQQGDSVASINAQAAAPALTESGVTQSEATPPRTPLTPPSTRTTGQKRRVDESSLADRSTDVQLEVEATQSDAGPSDAATSEGQQSQPQPKKKRAKRREYSVELRQKCVSMHEQGEGYRRIGQALDMPHTTVRAIVEKVTRTGSVLPAPRSGRPRKTDEIVDRVILEAVRNNEKCSARMIQEELERGYGVRISCETIRRRVKDHSRRSLARGGSLSPSVNTPSQASPTSAGVAMPSAVGAALPQSSGAPPPSAMPMGSLRAFQQQQQQLMHDEPMLQLLHMPSVSDDSTSVVL